MPSANTRSRGWNLTIGALSERTGVHIETIRYYERVGLLARPARSAGGHRLYADTHQRRLVFIRRSRELGFSIDQIRGLLGLERGHNLTCAEVKALAQQRIAEIRHKMKDLKRLERVLTNLAAQCHSGEAPECPILDALGREPAAPRDNR
jgi:MerR family mercuric resistance operon transcriptional regulator